MLQFHSIIDFLKEYGLISIIPFLIGIVLKTYTIKYASMEFY